MNILNSSGDSEVGLIPRSKFNSVSFFFFAFVLKHKTKKEKKENIMDGNIFNERIKKIDEVQSQEKSKSTPELKNILKLLTSLSHDLKN